MMKDSTFNPQNSITETHNRSTKKRCKDSIFNETRQNPPTTKAQNTHPPTHTYIHTFLDCFCSYITHFTAKNEQEQWSASSPVTQSSMWREREREGEGVRSLSVQIGEKQKQNAVCLFVYRKINKHLSSFLKIIRREKGRGYYINA